MTDILAILDDELNRTPHDAYMYRPLRRSVVAAAAAEIRRLRVQVAAIRNELAAIAVETTNDRNAQALRGSNQP